MPINQTKCGPGSTERATRELRKFLKRIVSEYGIETVNDYGCGDLYWLTLEQWDFDYLGLDEYIRNAADRRAQEGWILKEKDISEYKARPCDLAICKDVLRHHDDEGIRKILRNIDAKYLLADYDAETIINNSYHRVVDDYTLMGNSVNLADYIGEPIDSIESTTPGKRFGLFVI